MKIDYDCINYNALRIVQNENDDVLKRRMDGDKDLLECICQNKAHIYEVYFSWGDFPNC